MKFETEYQLQQFREEEPELFGRNGRANLMLTHQPPMEKMLKLINQMELEINSPLESEVLKKMDAMCIESLPPESFEKWEEIKEVLLNTRKDIKQVS